MISLPLSARKGYVHEALTFGKCLSMDLFFPNIFNLVPGVLDNFLFHVHGFEAV